MLSDDAVGGESGPRLAARRGARSLPCAVKAISTAVAEVAAITAARAFACTSVAYAASAGVLEDVHLIGAVGAKVRREARDGGTDQHGRDAARRSRRPAGALRSAASSEARRSLPS